MQAEPESRRNRAVRFSGRALATFAALTASLFAFACGANQREPSEYRLEKTMLRIGLLTREAPRSLTLTGRDLRLFVDGTPFGDGAGETQLEVAAGAGGGLQLRPRGQTWRRARHLVLTSPQPIRLQTSAAPDHTRVYPGDLELSAADAANPPGALRITLRMDALQYARAAARSELGAELLNELPGESAGAAGWRDELLRAASAAALSYALANRGRHAEDRFDLCDLTHCVHFPGLIAGSAPDLQDRFLILLTRARAPLASYFHSTCGGRLARPSSYWPRAQTEDRYFRSGPDQLSDGVPLCRASPHSRWSAILSREEFLSYTGLSGAAMATLHSAGRPHWQLERMDQRVTRLRLASATASADSAAFLSAAGRARGWNFIKSNDFTLSEERDRIRVRGRGLGHGIGLCQWGARELARRGKTAEEILAFYYPGAELARVRYATP